MTKTCKKCNIQKELKEFHKQARRLDGLHPWCKYCVLDYNRENKARKNERLRKWRKKNKERVRALDKKYKTKRRLKIREEQKTWQKAYRQKNESFRISQNLRSRTRLAIKNNQKAGSAVKDLGCSIEYLKQYLESQFKLGMSWENYGSEWHIDHIKPLSKFDLTNRLQFLKACHYTNLQPLWAKDNLSKGAS